MGRTTAVATVVAIGVGLLLGGCGSEAEQRAKDEVRDAADRVAELGVGAAAKGRWRCVTEQVENGETKRITTDVAIGDEGRFTWQELGEGADGPQVGTWAIDGLRLRLEVPWDDDGSNGFSRWDYEADADPPGHLSGVADQGTRQELDLTIEDTDEIRIVQPDDGEEGPDDLDYSWDTTCTREARDPGEIARPSPPPSSRRTTDGRYPAATNRARASR